MWEALADPNLAYGLLLAAWLFTAFAVLTPGTGLMELAALGLWVAAMLVLGQFSLRWWAVTLLLLALVPLGAALKRPRERRWMAMTIALVVLGAGFMVRPARGWLAVHPLWLLVAGSGFALLLWWGSGKIFDALHQPQLINVDRVVGQRGVTRTPVYHTGTVYVAGETWSARSQVPIAQDRPVRVVRREGLVLWVEPLEDAEHEQ